MKAKTAGFSGTQVQSWIRWIRQESAAFLLRHSVIFAKFYERQESKKGVFFAISVLFLNKLNKDRFGGKLGE